MSQRLVTNIPVYSQRNLASKLSKALLLLLSGGCVIGLLHSHDYVVAAILALLVTLMWWRTYRRNPTPQRALLLGGGTVLTACLGVQVELWGIDNAYWVYHDLTDGRHFPSWLPFAWMLAFIILYRVEDALVRHMNLQTLKNKLLLVSGISIILPTAGEIIAINLGVWTYGWGSQFFGVPALAIVLLTLFHLGIFVLITTVGRNLAIDDTVFGIPKSVNIRC